MEISKQAKEVLEAMIANVDQNSAQDIMEFFNEWESQGICLSCGETQHGVEPDAEGYTCNSCEETEVMGIENAVVIFF